MMNELGMGVVVSMKDMFTRNAHRIQGSMMSLDATVAASAGSMQRNMQLIQRGTMMMGAGLALLAVPAVVVTSTLRTQKALGEMASLGVKDLASLSAAAESFSNTWGGTSKAEFIAAAYDIKSGISTLTDAAVGEYTKLAALTAKATKSTVAEMTSLFATGYGIYRQMYARMSDFEFGRMFSGGMAASVQAFKTTGSGMASAISSLGATATTAKIPLQEQLAILGMLQATMSGAEAGTKYRAFMKSAAEAGKELNIEFVDQNNNLLGMTAILKKLKTRYGETLDAMEKMEIQKAFGRAEAVAVVDLFYTKIGDLTGNIRQMNVSMRQGTRLTLEMAQAMNMDIGSQLSLVAQQMHNLFEIMGEVLLPVVNPLIRGVSYIIQGLQRAAKAAPGLTRAVLVLSAALGAALVAVGGFMAAAGMVGIMLPAIKAGLIAIGGALAAVGSAVAAYILPAIAIIAGVVAAVYLLRKAWQTNFAGIRDVVMGAYTRIKAVFQGLWQLLSSLSSGTGRISAELAAKLKGMGLWGFVKTVFMVFHRAREYVVGYLTAIISAFKKVAKVLEPPIRALRSAYGALYKAIFSVVEIFGVAGTAADGSSFRSLGQTIGTVLGVIAQVGAYVLKFIIYPLSWTIRIVALVVRGVVLLVKGIVQGVIYAGKFLYKFALPFRMLIQAIAAVVKVAYALWQVLTGDISIMDGLKKIGGAILHYLATPFRWAKDVAAGAWRFIKSLFSGAVAFFKWAGGLIVSAILNLPIVKTLVGLWKSIRAFFSGDKTFFEAGKGILLAIGKGIWSAITLPYTLIKRAFSWLRRLLPFSDAQEGPLSTLTASGRAIITTICKGILGVAMLPLKIIGSIFRGALRIAGAVWSGVKSVVSKGWELVKGVGKAAVGILTGPFRVGISLAGKIWAGVKGVVSAGWRAVKGAGSAAWSAMSAPFRWFGKAASAAWSGVKGAVARGWEFVRGTGSLAVGILTAPFRMALFVGRSVWSGVKNVVSAGWAAIKGVGSTAWSVVSAPFRWIGSAASSVWSGIKGAASRAWDGMKSLASSAWGFLSAPFTKLRDVASGTWDWIKGKATGAWEGIKSAVASGAGVVKDVASTAYQAGKSVLNTVAEGAKAVITAPYNAVKKAFSAVRKLLPFSDAQEGPLANLSASGRAILETLTGGIERVGKLPATVFSKVWGFIGGIGKTVVSPKIEPSIVSPKPVNIEGNAPVVRPQVETGGILSRLPIIGGLMNRMQAGLSAAGDRLDNVLSDVWSRYSAFWEMMRQGARDTVAGLRQAAGVALPGFLAGTLSLTPVLAEAAPRLVAEAGVTSAVAAPAMPALVPEVMRLPVTPTANTTPTPLLEAGPMGAVATPVEKPTPTVVKEREIERTRMLAERVTTIAPAPQTNTAAGETGTPLAALLSKLDALGDRPIDVNVTVVSKLDGRTIAQAVYKDIRQQKVKNYETL